MNVLRIDCGQLSGRLSAVLSNGRVTGTETSRSMARRTGASAGVNGGFFVSRGLGGGDRPTQRPRHHLVYGDPSELVVLSPRFGSTTPGARPRVELVVRGGEVVGRRVGVGTAPRRWSYQTRS